MSHGRDTHTLRIEKRVIEEILYHCSHPDELREMIRLARAIVFDTDKERAQRVFRSYADGVPCILWQPYEGQRHVKVRVSREVKTVVVSVARIIWIITNPTAPSLKGSEEIRVTCGNHGDCNTYANGCLHPLHLVRNTAADRHQKVSQTMIQKLHKDSGQEAHT